MRPFLPLVVSAALTLSACTGSPDEATATSTSDSSSMSSGSSGSSGSAGSSERAEFDEFTVTDHGRFDEGWAMAFLPGTDQLLITERGGSLKLRDQATGEVRAVSGAPKVYHVEQAGFHDVVAGPTFDRDGTVYLSWVKQERGSEPRGVVARASLDTESAELTDITEIWQQEPLDGGAHFSLRMLIQDDHLFLTSGERATFDPAQDVTSNLGKILRLTLDGRPAPGNPFSGEGGRSDEVWSMGHRNPLGIDQDSTGQIWSTEMGPKGGDELNAIVEGGNYGWPEASMGVNYDGSEIPDHAEGDGFIAPAAYWVPSISPGSLEIYDGELFSDWADSALVGGLSGQTLVRLELDGRNARVVGQWDMGERIRAVEEAPDGSVWLLEDGGRGRLLELRPV